MSGGGAVYLSKVEIRNFRGYGDFSLPIPPKPCVVILSGPNGFGKTTLFEAVEWALTSTVKRLARLGKVPARDLARRSADVAGFRVALTFQSNDGAPPCNVYRTQSVAGAAAPAGTKMAEVATLLRSPDLRWEVTEDNIGDYLYLTHLHAQTAALRFVQADAKQRWLRVSPLAGADRFERVRSNLVSANGLITRMAKERELACDVASARIGRWTDLLSSRDRLLAAITASRDLISPSEIGVRISDARAHASGMRWPQLSTDVSDASAAAALLEADRLLVEREQLTCAERIARLSSARATATRWLQLQAQSITAADRFSRLKAQLEGAETALGLLAAMAERLGSERANAERRADEAARRLHALQGLVRDQAEIARLEQEAIADGAVETAAAGAFADEEVRVVTLEEQRARRTELERAVADAEQRLRNEERRLEAFSEASALELLAGEEARRREGLARELTVTDQELQQVARELSDAEQALAAAQNTLDLQRDATGALHQALSTILAHLSATEDRCPVCATTHDPEELRRKLTEALAGPATLLGDVEKAAVQMNRSASEVRLRHDAVLSRRGMLSAEIQSVEHALIEISQRREGLFEVAGGRNRVRDELESVRSEAAAIAKTARRELEGFTKETDLAKSLADAISLRESTRRRLAAMRERISNRRGTIEVLHGRVLRELRRYELQALREEALRLVIVQASSDAAEAAAQRKDADATFLEAREKELRVREQVQVTRENSAQASMEVDEVQRSVAAARDAWSQLGLAGDISESVIDTEIDAIRRYQLSLTRALQALLAAGAAVAAWMSSETLQRVETQIAAESSGIPELAHTAGLQQELQRANDAHDVARRTREESGRIASALQGINAEFGERSLKPFAELFGRYIRTLIHDERFHTMSVAYAAAARTGGLQFIVGLGDVPGTQAEFLLSEGQLGEVSVAAMLAASTAFPWSRWRALLLDDPTQYNDLIHAASLFDVLRNLALSGEYQVIISTHDGEQAEFLRRKLDAFSVEWVDCRYIGHGPNGIDVSITRSRSDPATA
jgi:DNA repair exonuclease SbcCD ATPase subunit